MTKSIAFEVNSIPFAPHLAATIGDSDATLVLQQLYYWLEKAKGRIVNGQKWIYNRLIDWLEQFPWLSEWKLRRVFRKLQDLGLVKFAQHDKSSWKRIGFYTIDFERLEPLLLSKCGISHLEVMTAHTSKCGLSTPLVEQRLLPETTSEITASAAAFLSSEQDQEVGREILVSLQNSTEATNEESKIIGEDLSSAAALQDEKIEVVEDVGIAMNPHLERSLLDFTLEQVKAAADFYRASKREKGEAKNPPGWFTSCLKGQWWAASGSAITTEYRKAKPWLDWAMKQGLICASTTDSAVTGSQQEIYVFGKATDNEFKPWSYLAEIYPLPFC